MAALHHRFDVLATRTSETVGSPGAMAVFVVGVVAWMASGPLLAWSDGWQLLINTPTTVITVGLVILLQYSTNKAERAIQLKLDVLIDASKASNRFASIEDLDAGELVELRDRAVAAMETAEVDQ